MEEQKEKSFERRQELISAALDEFSEKGYDNASLNNILKEAGISKGTFYYHFKNKEELYFYLIGILLREKKRYFSENIKIEDFNSDIFEMYKKMIKVGLIFARENPHINKFSESFVKEVNTEIYRKALGRFDLKSDDYFSALVDGACLKGEFRDDLPKEFIKGIISFLFSHTAEIAGAIKLEDFEPSLNNLIEFMKSGLASRKGTRA